eukprot:6176322-Pleurochrysis_carterae.AAC.2
MHAREDCRSQEGTLCGRKHQRQSRWGAECWGAWGSGTGDPRDAHAQRAPQLEELFPSRLQRAKALVCQAQDIVRRGVEPRRGCQCVAAR